MKSFGDYLSPGKEVIEKKMMHEKCMCVVGRREIVTLLPSPALVLSCYASRRLVLVLA